MTRIRSRNKILHGHSATTRSVISVTVVYIIGACGSHHPSLVHMATHDILLLSTSTNKHRVPLHILVACKQVWSHTSAKQCALYLCQTVCTIWSDWLARLPRKGRPGYCEMFHMVLEIPRIIQLCPHASTENVCYSACMCAVTRSIVQQLVHDGMNLIVTTSTAVP